MLSDFQFPNTFGYLFEGDGQQDIREVPTEKVVQHLPHSHVLLFRNFRITTDSFCAFSERLGCNFMNYQAGANERQKFNLTGTLFSVTINRAKTFIPFHGEMYYKKIKPRLLWFYCETPPSYKGETTVCDAAAVFNQLKPSTQQLFLDKKIKYIRTYKPTEWQKIYQTTNLDEVASVCADNDLQLTSLPNGGIRTEYSTYAAIPGRTPGSYLFINNILPIALQELTFQKRNQVRFADGSSIPLGILWEIWNVTAKLEIRVPWQKGDVLLVDNTYAMHGRRNYQGERKICARMSDSQFDLEEKHS